MPGLAALAEFAGWPGFVGVPHCRPPEKTTGEDHHGANTFSITLDHSGSSAGFVLETETAAVMAPGLALSAAVSSIGNDHLKSALA